MTTTAGVPMTLKCDPPGHVFVLGRDRCQCGEFLNSFRPLKAAGHEQTLTSVLAGLDVARLIVLLESQAIQRERDARFYRDLQRTDCVEECARAKSDAVLWRAVLARLQTSANPSTPDATGHTAPMGGDAWWHG